MDRMYEEVAVRDRLAEFYSPSEIEEWLYARHPMLGGERAIDLIHAGRAGMVMAVIDALSDLVYL